MRTLFRAVIACGIAAAVQVAGAGTARAGLDNELSLVDGHDRTLTVQQWDTFLNGVLPLDRNRLTREWFHSGKAAYTCEGAGCDDFAGTLELGYQIGFPWSLGVGINFSYTTPNILLNDANLIPVAISVGPTGPSVGPNLAFNPSIITPNLLPGASISADLGNGPGIQEVATFSIDVTGPAGSVAVSNAHGTLTGAAGGVLLRPFARLIAKTGDSVTSYGEPWNMN